MNCPNCGTPHDDNNTFCTSCGHAVLPDGPADVPPMAQPGAAPAAPASMTQPGFSPSAPAKPYKAEFIMGLIGSIIGAVMFLVLIIIGATSWWFGGLVIGGSMFVLAAFILGFIGTGQVGKGKGSGGILLTIGGGLGFIGMFFGVWISWITVFFFPLLLAAGIMALARRRSVEKTFPQ